MKEYLLDLVKEELSSKSVDDISMLSIAKILDILGHDFDDLAKQFEGK